MEKIKITSVFCFFLLATLLITYPLIFHLNDYLFGLDDELLITWIINWDIYSFTHNNFHIFQANMFYPYTNTLAYSDAFFTAAVLAFIPVKLTGNPAIAYNFNYLLTITTL